MASSDRASGNFVTTVWIGASASILRPTRNPGAARSCTWARLTVAARGGRSENAEIRSHAPVGARFYLNTSGTSDARRLPGAQLLATWLNFANGSLGWNQMVGSNCDGTRDTRFNQVIHHVEDVFLDAGSTRSQLVSQKAVLACVNGG